MPPDLELVALWLDRVKTDLRGAAVDLDADPALTDDACFHCQQAVEKSLKAYLTFRGIEFGKTHQVELLIEQCGDIDPAFQELHEEADHLTTYATRFRYPYPGPLPTDDRAREVLGVAQRVYRFVLSRVPEDTHPTG